MAYFKNWQKIEISGDKTIAYFRKRQNFEIRAHFGLSIVEKHTLLQEECIMRSSMKEFYMPVTHYAQSNDLRLRSFRIADAPAVFEYATDYQVTKFTHWQPHISMQQTHSFIKKQQVPNNRFLCAIEHKKERKIIGECGFINIQYPTAEIYYALSRYYWGHGLATQAVNMLMDYGFSTLFLTRIEAWIIADNFGSHRVALKNGMQCETVLYNHWYADEMYDIYVYAKEVSGHPEMMGEMAYL